MRFDNSFYVPAAPEQAWLLLLDVPAIAPCLPGARLTEVLAENRYKGQAVVRLGPVQLQFGGEAQLERVDETRRTARVSAKGADQKGRGSASATVDFALVPEGTGTRVNIETDLNLVGSVAQYGRASGLIKEIANEMVGQFAANLGKMIEGTPEAAPRAAREPIAAASAAGSSMAKPPRRDATPVSGFGILLTVLARMAGKWLGRLMRRAS